jgi:hypothetical protein
MAQVTLMVRSSLPDRAELSPVTVNAVSLSRVTWLTRVINGVANPPAAEIAFFPVGQVPVAESVVPKGTL